MADERRVITSAEVLAELGAKMEADPTFFDQLKQDPVATLDAMGIEVPPGVMVRIESDPDGGCHLVAYRSEGTELTDEELSKVAGGVMGPNYTQLASSPRFNLARNVAYDGVLIAYLAAGV